MKYADLKREFNVIIDVVGNSQITDLDRYNELKAQHNHLYEHNEYFIGVTLSFQIKDNVVEPMYVVNVVVKIDGSYYAVLVPSEEAVRIGDAMLARWKKGDEDFSAVIGKPNLHKED